MGVELIPDVGWFVNKPGDVGEGDLAAYLGRGSWVSPTPEQHGSLLAEMRGGEPIALKSLANRTAGLPFFNADLPVSTMTLWATGTIRSVDVARGTVRIDWDTPSAPRYWYFWTGIRALWQVKADPATSSVALLRFAFVGGDQDIGRFLSDPYWKTRYPRQPGFTWVDFYMEIGTRLAEYRENREPLLAALVGAAKNEPFLGHLVQDRHPDGSTGPFTDLDPFTVMGTFNRGLTAENRLRVAKVIGEILGVTAHPPKDLDGVPLLHNQKSWFIRYAKDRDPDDIDTLWAVFQAALDFADQDNTDTRQAFAAAYDAAQEISGVKWNLSQGLYWARPSTFVTLEGQSRPFIQSHFGLRAPRDGREYLQLIDELRGRFASGTTSITSFPLLSYAAWSRSIQHGKKQTMETFAYWTARMSEWVDLEVTEHNYKRATGALMREARDQSRLSDTEWVSTFKRALAAAGNLLHFMFKDDVAKAVASDPAKWSDILDTVWDDPEPESFDRLRDQLQQVLKRVTPGKVTSLGALLCLGDDPEENAPYLVSRTEKWYRLTGSPGPADSSSPSDRYRTMLQFLDALRREIEEQTGMAVSRLEAQGMAWSATEHPLPEEWEEGERAACTAWRSGADGVEPPRAWLVRPSKSVTLADWLEEERVSVAATWLGTVEPGSDLKSVKAAVEEGYPQAEYAERQSLTAEYHAFLTRMRPGDLVCARTQGKLHIGRLTGPATYDETLREDRLHRDVHWLSAIPTESGLPDPLPALLEQQGAVVDLTEVVEILEDLAGIPETADDEPPVVPKSVATDQVLRLPEVSATLAQSLHMAVAPLQEMVDLLDSRKQIVLYGPPGTGKTFIALALARHIVGEDNASHYQLVQFHPSYAYEDFFEGYRPALTDLGQATFEIVAGPLRRIASEAKSNPQEPFVLIIDEMNRANLAKVFGELYFLLEYRNQTIRLQYNPSEAFRLPPNLYVIGTMNTADRSIALLDAAMRRRFAFFELHPDELPVSDVLAKYLEARNQIDDPRADLLNALNRAIEDTDRDFKIGPSYLMRREADSDLGLARIWNHDILPLLEEHYYGRMTRAEVHAQFGLSALRRAVRSVSGNFGSPGELGAVGSGNRIGTARDDMDGETVGE